MNKLKITIAIIIYLLCATSFASQPKLKVVTEDWRPYSYLDENDQVKGIATEKVKRVLARTNLDYSIELLPWARAYKTALTTPNVLIYSIFRSENRIGKFHFICPLSNHEPQYFYKLKSRKDIQLETLIDAKNFKIGVVRDDFDHSYLVQHGFKENENLDAVAKDMGNIKRLFKGRLDLIVNSPKSIRREVVRAGYSIEQLERALMLPYSNQVENCLALSLGTPKATIDKVTQALIAENSSTVD